MDIFFNRLQTIWILASEMLLQDLYGFFYLLLYTFSNILFSIFLYCLETIMKNFIQLMLVFTDLEALDEGATLSAIACSQEIW